MFERKGQQRFEHTTVKIRPKQIQADSIGHPDSSKMERQTATGDRRPATGERRTANGERRTANGERRTANGERKVLFEHNSETKQKAELTLAGAKVP
jgi:hypothetical protein